MSGLPPPISNTSLQLLCTLCRVRVAARDAVFGIEIDVVEIGAAGEVVTRSIPDFARYEAGVVRERIISEGSAVVRDIVDGGHARIEFLGLAVK